MRSWPYRPTPARLPPARGRVLYPDKFDVGGKHILVIDDILDSGKTLHCVTELDASGAASVKTCVLLRKQIAASQPITADFIGFDIPNEFVVGYGLDYNDYYRNLPDIAILRRRVFQPYSRPKPARFVRLQFHAHNV